MKHVLYFAALMCCCSVHADYLLWQIDQTGTSETPLEFSYAKILVQGEGVSEGTYLSLAGTGDPGFTEVVHSGYPDPLTGSKTDPVYAVLGDFGQLGYSFAAELYRETDDGDVFVGRSAFVSYASLEKFHVYSNMSLTGIDPYKFSAFSVPEPTSGLLVLLGFGLMALRRKKSKVEVGESNNDSGLRLKKVLFAFGLLAVGAVFAAQDDTLLTFSTPGPDKYADGSAVLNGESYAVVWTKDGATFGGLTAEGTVISENDKLVFIAPIAKDAHCPLSVLSISADAMSQYENGSFSLYLLDTRVKKSDGKTALAPKTEKGVPETVNSVGEAAADRGDGRIVAASGVKLGAVGVYTKIESPVITAMKIESATIRLEVKGMSKAASYFVVPGDVSGNFAPAMDADQDEDGFTFPKPEAPASIYKVIGVRNFDAAK